MFENMNIVSWNVNGIRACAKKGFLSYLEETQPDICCIQESKALESDLSEELKQPPGYESIWHSAEKKGYSGVAIFTKIKPISVNFGLGIEKFDSEGRVIQAEFENFILFSVYFPNGQKNEERLAYKLEFFHEFFKLTNDLVKMGKNVIICGDYNIAHTAIDLANPKANEKYSGYLPIERAWMDKIVSDGYIDTFRYFNKEPKNYSWWSYRAGARKRNIGWRIDYFFVSPSLKNNLQSASIHSNVLGSDHCPVSLTLTIN